MCSSSLKQPALVHARQVRVHGLANAPEAVALAGGDPPLVWTTPTVYSEESLGENQFAGVGAAQGWQGADAVFDYTLPFAFPFYGEEFTDVKVACDGWINFGPYIGSTWNNSEILLAYNKRIAVLWDDLRTDQGGDIYIDESIPGQVTVRWDAVTHSGLDPCNFSATLFDDGQIQLDYGSGNTPITATVGVSAGDEVRYFLSSYDAQPDLGGVDSLMIDYSRLPPGLQMSTKGIITGTPTEAGEYQVMFHVEDDSQRTDSKLIPLTVLSDVLCDYDLDHDVDLDDLVWFVTCMEQLEPTARCLGAFDTNDDEAVSLADFAVFQLGFTGPL